MRGMEPAATKAQRPTLSRERPTFWSKFGVFLLLAAGIGASFLADAPVEGWVAAHHDPAWENVAKNISRYGAWHWLMAASLVALAIAKLRQRRDWIRILAAMMIAASIAGLTADCIRGLTGRARPNADVPQAWYGMRHDSKWLIGRHAYNAFPSGHTTVATAFATVLWLSHRRRGAVLLLGAIIVGGSRIYLSDHHFSDVVAGFALGGAVATWVWPRVRDYLPPGEGQRARNPASD